MHYALKLCTLLIYDCKRCPRKSLVFPPWKSYPYMDRETIRHDKTYGIYGQLKMRKSSMPRNTETLHALPPWIWRCERISKKTCDGHERRRNREYFERIGDTWRTTAWDFKIRRILFLYLVLTLCYVWFSSHPCHGRSSPHHGNLSRDDTSPLVMV